MEWVTSMGFRLPGVRAGHKRRSDVWGLGVFYLSIEVVPCCYGYHDLVTCKTGGVSLATVYRAALSIKIN